MERFDRTCAYIWLIHVSAGPALPSQWSMLDEVERRRAESFYFEKDRWLYVKAHAWLRTILGRISDKPPQELEIFQPPFVKPSLMNQDREAILFSLSHTDGMVGIALNWQCDIGIDVEKVRHMGDLQQVVASTLHPTEFSRLNTLPDEERMAHFFRIWTAKEAYTKALGRGLEHPFNEFSVDLNGHETQSAIGHVRDKSPGIPPAYLHSSLLRPDLKKPDAYYTFSFCTLGRQIPFIMQRMNGG